ncbi:hypothetical protein QBC38DRAFT_451058 [Podospora fimiseda]|uniref:Uncharacterized protein n=1 Tax=Podospora fimiseda TaxID=252190 RepID=A0AAN7BYA1_9PEZI|nr:hypothetical protein QBC38DRAFT_451058 [Podospora fimiseda]
MAFETNGIPAREDVNNNPQHNDDNNGRKHHHTSFCSPLGLLRAISNLWPTSSNPEPKTNTNTNTTEKKKYVHVPTHAAKSHLRTTSSPSIRRANEVLQ